MGMVHGEGHRQLPAETTFEPVMQFDGHQRIHAEIEEPRVVADVLRVDPSHVRDGVA